jgi:hypothetical protein
VLIVGPDKAYFKCRMKGNEGEEGSLLTANAEETL